MGRFKGQSGMSLVEATIILLVLMLLTGVIAPSIADFVNDAKRVKVKEDCEAIGVTVARLQRDVGECLKFDGTKQCTKANRVDILYSDGPDVLSTDLADEGTATYADAAVVDGILSWDRELEEGDSMEDQFVRNFPDFPTPNLHQAAGIPTYDNQKPWFNFGWRGAYIQSPVSWDPWGHRYLVNSAFLSVAMNAKQAAPYKGEGEMNGGWNKTVICLSAGPNGLYQTAFAQSPTGGSGGVNRIGDDYFYPIQGSSH